MKLIKTFLPRRVKDAGSMSVCAIERQLKAITDHQVREVQANAAQRVAFKMRHAEKVNPADVSLVEKCKMELHRREANRG